VTWKRSALPPVASFFLVIGFAVPAVLPVTEVQAEGSDEGRRTDSGDFLAVLSAR